MQSFHDLKGGRLFLAAKAWRVRAKFQADHQSEPAHLFQHARKLANQTPQFIDHESTELARVVGELIARDDFKNLQRDRASERIAAERRRVCSSRKHIGKLVAHPERADRESAAERFRHRDPVGKKIFRGGNILEDALPTVKRSGPEMARLHFVEEQQKSLFIAEFSETEKIFRRRRRDPAFALDRFDQNGRGSRRDRGADRVEIVERHLAETLHHRLKTFFHFFLTSRRDSRQRPPVERTVGGENFESAAVVPKFSRQLVEAFIRFRAAVAKEAAAGSDQPNECFGELRLGLCEIKIRNMEQLSRLLEQRVGDLGIRVAQCAHRDAASEIEISFARDIVNVTPLPVIERQIETRKRGNDVFAKQLPNFAQPIHLDRLHLAADLHLHRTTSVPTPASVKISSRIECGTRPSTNCTFSTPLWIAATALSTFGIIPSPTTPRAFNSGTSLALKWRINEFGSLGSRRSPGTSLMKTSRRAQSATAVRAAATSALQL